MILLFGFVTVNDIKYLFFFEILAAYYGDYEQHICEACNFTKSNTPPWMFFTFFKLYKWYQIAQRITYDRDRRQEFNL